MSIKIQLRRDTASNWSAVNPILAEGEIGVDLTNNTFKLGDGVTDWNNLNSSPIMSGQNDISGCNWFLDEADLISASHEKAPSQYSVKTFVETVALNRSNHTGTQLANTISDFNSAVALSGATMNSDNNISTNAWVLDEDDMHSNSPVKVPTQQSTKSYIDNNINIVKANITLNTFRIIEQSGFSIYNMVDGFSDSYEDVLGIDSTSSVNQVYIIDGYFGNVVLYDVSNISYDNVNFDVSSILSSSTDLQFNNDGSKLYVLVENGIIYEFDLSSNYDISTAVYNSVNKDISSIQTLTEGMYFSNNGAKLFVVDQNVRNITEFVLTVPWDISTISATGNTFSINSQDARPTGVFITENGLKLFVVGNANDNIYEYHFSTPNDLTTLTYVGLYSLNSNNIECFSFKSDGFKLYTLDNNGDIQQYSLSTAWDISTLNYDSILKNILTGTEQPHGLVIKPDGTKLYTIAVNEDIVKQYSFVKTNTDNITLQSIAVSALTSPDNCFIVLEDKYIDADLNLDLEIYVSRDNGNTWELGSLTKVADLPDSHRISISNIDVSLQPAGNLMKYKIISKNNKKIEIHATSLQWS